MKYQALKARTFTLTLVVMVFNLSSVAATLPCLPDSTYYWDVHSLSVIICMTRLYQVFHNTTINCESKSLVNCQYFSA